MELDGIIFHGNLEEIKKMKYKIGMIPEGMILDRDMDHGYFDVEMKNDFVIMYPRYARVPLKLDESIHAFHEKDFATFRFAQENSYKLFYEKEYFEKEIPKQESM
jgi:hypothetical protein